MVRPSTDYFSGISPGLFPALGASVLLHLGVLLGVQPPPAAQERLPHVLEAHLQAAAPARIPVAPHTPPTSRARPAIPNLAQPALRPVIEAAPASQPAAPTVEAPHNDAASIVVPPNTVVPGPVAAEPAYYESTQLDAPPRMLGDVQQVYPARARNAEVEGFVTLSLLINERGEVEEVSVVKAQPQGYFEEAASAMLRKQRFSPAIKQGRAVKSRWAQTVRYRLQG